MQRNTRVFIERHIINGNEVQHLGHPALCCAVYALNGAFDGNSEGTDDTTEAKGEFYINVEEICIVAGCCHRRYTRHIYCWSSVVIIARRSNWNTQLFLASTSCPGTDHLNRPEKLKPSSKLACCSSQMCNYHSRVTWCWCTWSMNSLPESRPAWARRYSCYKY